MKAFEGQEMYALAERLFPICRSITGNGVRQTLAVLSEFIDGLKIHEIPTGEQCLDWVIPNEWNIREAFIEDPQGRRIIDFKNNNLHVLNYSTPVEGEFDLEELRPHLYSLPQLPDAIPYKTSYFKERWGFCLSHNQLQELKPGKYYVKIDSTLAPGSLTFAEKILPGRESKEVLLSTYVCHPSMANNELSGPVLATALYKFLAQRNNRYTYRFVFVPETIGAIAYLSRNLEVMKKNTVAGFQLTCVGDNRSYSYMPSRKGGTIADKLAQHVLSKKIGTYKKHSYLERGSDERQYCAPGIDLPVVSMMRTRYGDYPEYHTSLDDMSLISAQGLNGALEVHRWALELLENNYRFQVTTLGEPQLGRRNMRDSLGAITGGLARRDWVTTQLVGLADGSLDLVDLANELDVFGIDLLGIVENLRTADLLRVVD